MNRFLNSVREESIKYIEEEASGRGSLCEESQVGAFLTLLSKETSSCSRWIEEKVGGPNEVM